MKMPWHQTEKGRRNRRQYYLANREKFKAYTREYWRVHRRDIERTRRHNLGKYGLTIGGWIEMLIEQAGRCAVCNEPMQHPCVDHDHNSDVVRGLVHQNCNLLLGQAKDSPQILEQAAAYLRRVK